MSTVAVYNQTGQKTGERELNVTIFGVKVRVPVVHQVYVALMANKRQPWADTKDKSEVRGGGKKPWKQKGTGRARHGSIRSPIWSGGGVTFGPLSIRSYKQKINKKMNRAAMRMVLSDRAKDGQLVLIESLPSDAKTKTLSALRQALPGVGKSTLLVTGSNAPEVRSACANLERFDVVRAEDLNVADIMKHQFIFLSSDAVLALETRLSGK